MMRVLTNENIRDSALCELDDAINLIEDLLLYVTRSKLRRSDSVEERDPLPRLTMALGNANRNINSARKSVRRLLLENPDKPPSHDARISITPTQSGTANVSSGNMRAEE